jgi:hypothetical protein
VKEGKEWQHFNNIQSVVIFMTQNAHVALFMLNKASDVKAKAKAKDLTLKAKAKNFGLKAKAKD